MLERGVQAVVVVGRSGALQGTIVERQLTLERHVRRLAACRDTSTLPAAEVMDRGPTCATVGESLDTVVQRMVRRAADCVVVCRGDEVIGLLGGHDLLRQMADQAPPAHVADSTPRLARPRGPLMRTIAAHVLTAVWQ